LHRHQQGGALAGLGADGYAALLGPQHEFEVGGAHQGEAVGTLRTQGERDHPVVFVFHHHKRNMLGCGHGVGR